MAERYLAGERRADRADPALSVAGFDLYGVAFDVTSPVLWAVGIGLAGIGTWLFLRAARLGRDAYDKVVAQEK